MAMMLYVKHRDAGEKFMTQRPQGHVTRGEDGMMLIIIYVHAVHAVHVWVHERTIGWLAN